MLESWEADGRCTVIGHERRLDAAGAAFVNGTAAHGEDFDDTFEGGPVHAGVVMVPAILAAAERHKLSGADALAYLNAASKMAPGAGAFAQFAGVQLLIEGGAVKQASIKSQPIDPAKTYRMAINSFMAAGGDGYPRMKDRAGYVDTGFVDADMLRAFVTARSPIRALDYAPGSAVLRQ